MVRGWFSYYIWNSIKPCVCYIFFINQNSFHWDLSSILRLLMTAETKQNTECERDDARNHFRDEMVHFLWLTPPAQAHAYLISDYMIRPKSIHPSLKSRREQEVSVMSSIFNRNVKVFTLLRRMCYVIPHSVAPVVLSEVQNCLQ